MIKIAAAEMYQARSDNSALFTRARVAGAFDDFARKALSDVPAVSTCAFVWVGFFAGAPVVFVFAAARFLFRAWAFLRCDFFAMGLTYLRNFRVTAEEGVVSPSPLVLLWTADNICDALYISKLPWAEVLPLGSV